MGSLKLTGDAKLLFVAFTLVITIAAGDLNALAAAAPAKIAIGYATFTARIDATLDRCQEQGIFAKYGIDASRFSFAARRPWSLG